MRSQRVPDLAGTVMAVLETDLDRVLRGGQGMELILENCYLGMVGRGEHHLSPESQLGGGGGGRQEQGQRPGGQGGEN